MPTKAEVTAHWTDTGRRLFLAEVKVKTDHLRDFPRLTIEVPDQRSQAANVQEVRRALPPEPLANGTRSIHLLRRHMGRVRAVAARRKPTKIIYAQLAPTKACLMKEPRNARLCTHTHKLTLARHQLRSNRLVCWVYYAFDLRIRPVIS